MLDLERFRALTFDCYGTLIDWESGILSAVRPVLAAHGCSLDDEGILKCYARLESEIEQSDFRPYRRVLREVMDGFGRELSFAPDERQQAALVDSIGGWPVFPDTVESLRALEKRYRLAIVSNVDEELFAATAKHLEVPFDRVITAGRVGAYKPSAKMFHAAIESLGLPKEAILHVAQSLHHDVAPARELGLATVWVRRRGVGATPESTVKPDLELADLRSLVSALALG